MKVVKFINSATPYVVGDVAGFPDHIADRYVDAGVAVEVRRGKPKREGAKAPKTKPASAPVKK